MRKNWYKSKTLWVNLTVLTLEILEAKASLLSAYLPKGAIVGLGISVPIINIWLRTITTAALGLKGSKDG